MEPIREVKIDDLEELLPLLYQLSPLKEKEDMIVLKSILQTMIADHNYDMVVYEEDDKLLGTAALMTLPNLSHGGKSFSIVGNVVTTEASRGKGVGKKMVLELLEIAKKKNLYKVILDCAKHNIPFYEKCGFSETGEVEMRFDL